MEPSTWSAVPSAELGQSPGGLEQPGPEHGVGQVGPRLVQRRDGVGLRHRAMPEPGQLGEHEPHPVTRLVTPPHLGERRCVSSLRF